MNNPEKTPRGKREVGGVMVGGGEAITGGRVDRGQARGRRKERSEERGSGKKKRGREKTVKRKKREEEM